MAENRKLIVEKQPEYSKETYLRTMLLCIANDYHMPSDIFSSEFSNVNFDYVPYVHTEGNVHMECRSSIGYQGPVNSYERAMAPLTYFGGMILDSDIESDYAVRSLINPREMTEQEIKDSEMKADTKSSGTQDVISIMKRKCKAKAKLPKNIPDLKFDGKVDCKYIDIVNMPVYSCNYKYKGKEYKTKGFATGIPYSITEVPEVEGKSLQSRYSSHSKELAKEKMKPLKYGLFGCLGLLVISIILAIVGGVTGLTTLGTVGVIFAGLSIFAGIALFIIKSNPPILDKFIHKADKESADTRIDSLKAILSKQGLKPLTEDEIDQINSHIYSAMIIKKQEEYILTHNTL